MYRTSRKHCFHLYLVDNINLMNCSWFILITDTKLRENYKEAFSQLDFMCDILNKLNV